MRSQGQGALSHIILAVEWYTKPTTAGAAIYAGCVNHSDGVFSRRFEDYSRFDLKLLSKRKIAWRRWRQFCTSLAIDHFSPWHVEP